MLPYSLTPQALFEELLPQKLASQEGPLAPGGRLEVTLEGEDGGVWTVDLDGRRVSPGEAEKPALLVRAQARDFLALLAGRMSVEEGLLSERLHVAGEGGRLVALFGTLRALFATGSGKPR